MGLVGIFLVSIDDVFAAEVSVPSGSSVPGCEETNECYIPYTIIIDIRDTVTWRNDDTAAHTVTSGTAADGPDGNFDSGLFLAGTTFSHTFREYGWVHYYCIVHPWMTGIVNVGSVPEPEPEPVPESEPVCGAGLVLDGVNCVREVNAYRKTHIENFPDPKKSPQYYFDRYNSAQEYKEWFDRVFPGKTIEEVVGYKKTHVDIFPDNNKSPFFYIDRYFTEDEYKSWFDENFDEPISSILGISEEDTATLIAKIADQFRIKHQFEKASLMTNTALSFDSENIAALYQIGLIQWEKGYLNQAKPIFEKILELDPNHVNATTSYGDILLEENNLEFALIYYEKALKIKPDDLYGLTGKGTILLQRGNSEGMVYFDEAIKLYPDTAVSYSHKAWALDELGNLDEALFYYIKALEIDPDDTWNLNNIGNLFMQQGKYDEAIPYFEKSLEIWPENEYAKNNLQDALAQTITSKDQKSETTEEEFNQSLLKIQDLMNKAMSSAGAGNENAARNYLRQATKVLENELEPLITDPQAKTEIRQRLDFLKGQLNMQEQSAGGCLIATATFGSELAPQVQQLREIRDNSLLQTESGSAFMESFNQFYYSFSPVIADLERENPVFKEIVKVSITPLLSSLSLLNYVDMDSEYEVLGYGISLIILNVGMYFVAPALIVIRIFKR